MDWIPESVTKFLGLIGGVGVIGAAIKWLWALLATQKADLTVDIEGDGPGTCYIVVTNRGPAKAKNVRIELPDRDPELANALEPFPHPMLEAGKSVKGRFARFVEHRKTTYKVKVVWKDWRTRSAVCYPTMDAEHSFLGRGLQLKVAKMKSW